MRTMAFLGLALGSLIATTPLSLRAPLPQITRSSCCAFGTTAGGQSDDCGRHSPNSKQDRQCCANCFIPVVASLNSASGLIPPTPDAEEFPCLVTHEQGRTDRPPVPPPRALFA